MTTISLEKRTEAAQVSLLKVLQDEQDKGNELGEISAQVILVMDFSGSMQERYDSGEVQQLAERFLALSMAGLDDDQKVPVYFFDTEVYNPVILTPDNYKGFVDTWRKGRRMGGTKYSPFLHAILGKVSPTEKDEPPVFVGVITDGSPARSDRSLIKQALIHNSDRPFFFQFMGVNENADELEFLQELNNGLVDQGASIDNVGVTIVEDTLSMDDSQFNAEIISEVFPKWLPEARRQKITNQ